MEEHQAFHFTQGVQEGKNIIRWNVFWLNLQLWQLGLNNFSVLIFLNDLFVSLHDFQTTI
jgi:hypothetical protein